MIRRIYHRNFDPAGIKRKDMTIMAYHIAVIPYLFTSCSVLDVNCSVPCVRCNCPIPCNAAVPCYAPTIPQKSAPVKSRADLFCRKDETFPLDIKSFYKSSFPKSSVPTFEQYFFIIHIRYNGKLIVSVFPTVLSPTFFIDSLKPISGEYFLQYSW